MYFWKKRHLNSRGGTDLMEIIVWFIIALPILGFLMATGGVGGCFVGCDLDIKHANQCEKHISKVENLINNNFPNNPIIKLIPKKGMLLHKLGIRFGFETKGYFQKNSIWWGCNERKAVKYFVFPTSNKNKLVNVICPIHSDGVPDHIKKDLNLKNEFSKTGVVIGVVLFLCFVWAAMQNIW